MTEDEMDCILDSMDMSLSKFHGIVKDREAWLQPCSAAAHGVVKNRTQLSN